MQTTWTQPTHNLWILRDDTNRVIGQVTEDPPGEFHPWLRVGEGRILSMTRLNQHAHWTTLTGAQKAAERYHLPKKSQHRAENEDVVPAP